MTAPDRSCGKATQAEPCLGEARRAEPSRSEARRAEDWHRVLTALTHGDRVAYLRVSGLVMGLLTRLRLFEIQSHWDDVCQEVLLKLIQNLRSGSIRDMDRFVGYCATLTRRQGMEWLRKLGDQRNRTSRTPVEEVRISSARSEAPDLRVQIARALDELSEKQRQVIHAIYLRGCTYEEAASELGMPLGTLKRAQTEALRELREKMGIS